MNMDDEIYLAILKDRHIDIQIAPFRTKGKAMMKIQEWKKQYEAQRNEKWIVEEIQGWEYYIQSGYDDGPKMRIEKKYLG